MDPNFQQQPAQGQQQQQQTTVIELPATTVNQVVDQHGEQIVLEANCDQPLYRRDLWLNAIVLLFIPIIGWIALLIFLPVIYCQVLKSVNSWYLYLTHFHINYSGFGDPSAANVWGTRTRRIALSDIQSIGANQPVGCDCWPPLLGYFYCPSSRNTVVVWLKPEKRAAYRFLCRPDCVEIRYVANPDEFVAAVQKQISALPQPTQ